MEKYRNNTQLNYPWNKFVLYIFDELEGDELAAIENMIVENDEYTLEVSKLTDFFKENKINSSDDFDKHLEKIKADVFQGIEQRSNELPEEIFKPNDVEIDESQKSLAHQNLNKNRSRRIISIITVLLIILVAAAISYFFINRNHSESTDSEETSTLPKKNNIEQPIKVDSSIFNSKIPIQDTLKDIPNDSPSISNPNKRIKSPKDIIPDTPLSPPKEKEKKTFTDVRIEMENLAPLQKSAEGRWENDFTFSGSNTDLKNAKTTLEKGDTTQRALYCVGLHELTQSSPNIDKAIELLEKVDPDDFADATWFLFRAYVAAGNLNKAKEQYQIMESSSIKIYYEDNFFVALYPSSRQFFQAKSER